MTSQSLVVGTLLYHLLQVYIVMVYGMVMVYIVLKSFVLSYIVIDPSANALYEYDSKHLIYQ